MKNLIVISRTNNMSDIVMKIHNKSDIYAIVQGDLDNAQFLEYINTVPTIGLVSFSNIENKTLKNIEDYIRLYDMFFTFVIEKDDLEMKTYYANFSKYIDSFAYIHNKNNKGKGRFIGECRQIIKS
ncbi:MAG: hypothetical protein RBR02_06435 [Desulfuromonadaceae bacterium]|nr:hypothetical protein [Desulfuromonadaceae bacterium]